MRVALTNICKYHKNIPKVPLSKFQKPQTKLIVDPCQFRESGLFAILQNKLKNSNAIFEAKRNVQNFSVPSFQLYALERYRQFVELYNKKNYKEIQNYISDPLYRQFKAECKNKGKNQAIDFGWGLIDESNKAELVQARIHSNKLSAFVITDRWFQMTCVFKNAKGQQVCNVLQKHEKNKQFKFIKFNI